MFEKKIEQNRIIKEEMISGTIIRKNTKTQSAEHSSITTKKEKEIINSLKQNSAKQRLPSYALPVAAVSSWPPADLASPTAEIMQPWSTCH